MRASIALIIAVFIAVGVGVGIEAGSQASRSSHWELPRLDATGLGVVRFGGSQALVVAELTRLLGAPSQAEPSSGCGPRFSEVEWGDLAVEFRQGMFTGYRYLRGGLEQVSTAEPDQLARETPRPALETSEGITLGSTLAQLRRAYGAIHPVGTFRWETANGLIFDDNAETEPDPSNSRIIEIKIGTCGDY